MLADFILDYQREGPYFLGGWSASGVVAYETARQLIERGHRVALVAMFDTSNPEFQRRVMKEAWLDSRARKVKFLWAELRGLKLKDAPAYSSGKVKELRRKVATAAWRVQNKVGLRLNSGPLDEPGQILHLAVNQYRPLPFNGRLLFFNAAERPPGDAWDLSRGWSRLVTGQFEVYEIPGDHRSMFLEPNVEHLADYMTDCFWRKEPGPL